jgi:hypothetical protein
MTYIPEKYLVTASGRIKCVRCKAFLKKYGRQCLRPAIKGKTCCSNHGGKSTGPRTQEGIERIRKAHLKTGNETLAAKQSRSKQILRLQMLEQCLYLLNLTNAPRNRGPKAKGFKTIKSIQEVKKVLDEY